MYFLGSKQVNKGNNIENETNDMKKDILNNEHNTSARILNYVKNLASLTQSQDFC